ncbi:fungal-specific transcription factor domain-containing protein [Tricladium varicosporioides]|nr:fungal-specific transcription factor domain-containing protein [Hymenoscyphus varicosporioides]
MMPSCGFRFNEQPCLSNSTDWSSPTELQSLGFPKDDLEIASFTDSGIGSSELDEQNWSMYQWSDSVTSPSWNDLGQPTEIPPYLDFDGAQLPPGRPSFNNLEKTAYFSQSTFPHSQESKPPATETRIRPTSDYYLLNHFFEVLLPFIHFDENTCNEFQCFLLPFSRISATVSNALLALSSAHLERKGIQPTKDSQCFHTAAVQGLAKLTVHVDESNKDEILATVLLLTYYDHLTQRGDDTIDGLLKLAMTILHSFPQSFPTPVNLFFQREFSLHEIVRTIRPASTLNTAGTEQDTTLNYTSISNFLRLPTTLWPIINRLPQLRILRKFLEAALAENETGKAAVLRTEFDNASQGIKLALQGWKAPLLFDDLPAQATNNSFLAEASTDDAARAQFQCVVNHTEAFRHSAFVYLYRVGHSYPRTHPLLQKHISLALSHCAEAVRYEGDGQRVPKQSLLWPLCIAACQAISQEHRDLATHVLNVITSRGDMSGTMCSSAALMEMWWATDLATVN